MTLFFFSPQLKREHDRLLPHLKALSEKEQAQAKIMQDKNQGLGLSQAFEFGQQFNKEWGFFSRFFPRFFLNCDSLDARSWKSCRPIYLTSPRV